MFKSILLSLQLLDRRSQRILLLLVGVQAALATLDLAGVVLIGVVAALGTSAASGVTPTVVSEVMPVAGMSETTLAVGLAAIAGLVLVSKSLLGFLLIRRSLRFLANRQAIVASRLAVELFSRPLLAVQAKPSQERTYALTYGVNAATVGVLGNAVIVASESAVLIALGTALLFLDPLVALFALAFFAAIGLALNQFLGRWARHLGQLVSQTDIASVTTVQDAMRTYREMMVSGRRAMMVERFQGIRWQAAKVQADYQVLSQVSKYVFEIALVLGASALALSQLRSRDAVAAVAIIAVFLAASARIMPSMLRLQQAVLGIRTSSGVAATTLDLASEVRGNESVPPPSTEDSRLPRDVDEAEWVGFMPSIDLFSVSLTYPGMSRPAVHDLKLHVDPGESLALVGPTGAGKSTLADLILGVLQPTSGQVLLSGVSPDAAISRWPGSIGYVPQEIAVIAGSVRENVALGLPRQMTSDDQVWEALSVAGLAEFLRSQREGLETVVGEHGLRLSGGQRQRLGVARALYTKPRLLVLDEATSALDAETEKAISDSLLALRGYVTLVLVAHRLATVRYCTHVAYLEDGELLAMGSFEEVRKAQPRFDRQAHLLGL